MRIVRTLVAGTALPLALLAAGATAQTEPGLDPDSVFRLAIASSARVVAIRWSRPGQLRTSCRRA